MQRSRATRVGRGVSAASIATFAALCSHVTAGGEVPGWLGLAVPWVLSIMLCTLLAGRRLSAVRLSLSVAVSQLLFHTLFVLGAPRSATAIGHVHGDHVALAPLSTADATAAAICADPGMWLGHGLAALATVLAIHRGERTLGRLAAFSTELLGWLRRRLGVVLFTQRVAAHPVMAPAWPVVTIRPLAPHLASLLRRGPPSPRTV